MNLAAIIDERTNNHGGRDFVAWVYDKDKPRDPSSPEPKSRYECVNMLGPFAKLDDAVRACAKAGIQENDR